MDVKERVKELKRSTACCICRYYKHDKCENKKSCFWKDLEQALTELEEIKVFCESLEKDIDRLNQQCIDFHLKDVMQSKVLEVLKNKMIVIERIKKCENVNAYNNYVLPPFSQLTETEFDLIKEW